MRRWLAAPLLFVAVASLLPCDAPRARAQPAAGQGFETFKTADGVELQGLFHPANTTKPSEAPVVVFLYQPGPDRDMTKGDWAGLAKALTKEGYHVFQFDWRGHGKSTSIKDKQTFWGNPFLNNLQGGVGFNSLIKGGPPAKPLKSTLSVKDLGNNAATRDKYLPAYLIDLAAVRYHLDEKNDNKDLNSSSIYLVGANEAATLGMAWLAAEWKRPATGPNVAQLGGNPNYLFVPQPVGGKWGEAGNDYGGAVWLTATYPPTIPSQTIQQWVSRLSPKIRENNPMLFLHGEKDVKGMKESKFFYSEVLVADPPKGTALEKLDQTRILPVKDSQALTGVKLLSNDTNSTIVQYFAFIQKTRKNITSKAREFKDPYFVDLNAFGLQP
jgi:pimeloyl-ACP methyl ester carboxylesterase